MNPSIDEIIIDALIEFPIEKNTRYTFISNYSGMNLFFYLYYRNELMRHNIDIKIITTHEQLERYILSFMDGKKYNEYRG